MNKILKHLFSFSIFLLFQSHFCAQTPTLQWANSFGSGLGLVDGDFVKGMVKDKQGNFFITGMIQGTVDFDPTAANFNLSSSGSDKDIYTAKYDPSGNLIWAKLINGYPFEDVVRAITIDTSDNVYVAGITNFLNPSCIIRKWDTNGNVLWTKQSFGEINIKDMIAAGNELLISGTFLGTIDFDFSTGIYSLSSKTNLSSDEALFLAKYDQSGNLIFARKIYSNSANSYNISLPYIPKFGINGGIPSIAADDSGNIYVCDKFSDTASFDLPVNTVTLNGGPTYQSKLFIAKYTPTGQFVWVKSIHNKQENSCAIMNTSIKINNNTLYISGSFRGDSVDFDPSGSVAYVSTPTMVLQDSWNTFMAAYDLNGNYKWAKALVSPHNNFLGTMRVDHCSNIYISGDFSFNLDFDPSPNQAAISTNSLSYTNAFIAKYDSSGNYKWVMGILGKGYNGRPEYLEVHGRLSFELDSNNIYLAGTYLDTLDMDPSVNSSYIGSLNSSRDFFVAKYKRLESISCGSVITTSAYEHNTSLTDAEIYPNPFENILTVKTKSKIKTIEIHNLLGERLLLFEEQKNTETQLNLNALEKGVYLIKITSTDNTTTSWKIVRE